MPGGVRGQAVLHEFIRQHFDRISLSDPNETASEVFESRGVRAEFFQAPLNPLDLTERLLPVLSKSRCELGIGAVEPLRKMVQGVDSRPFHRMGIAQPSNERVRLVCHGLSPLSPALTKRPHHPVTGAAIASSRWISRVASVTLHRQQPMASGF